MRRAYWICILLALASLPLAGQTIAEKKAQATSGGQDLAPEMQKFLLSLNRELKQQHELLRQLYQKARTLKESDADPKAYQELLLAINAAKKTIALLQDSWREMAALGEEDSYALWHNPQTTLEQLVIDYGSLDYVYLIPPEIGAIEIGVNSNIPIPRRSWSEILELILRENGVGIKELNPYLRQLYLIAEDHSNLALITTERRALDFYPDTTRICFMLQPEPAEVQRIWFFLEKFVSPKSTVLELLGRNILIIGEVATVKELLKIYDFVIANTSSLDYRVVPLRRVTATEMAKVIETLFEQLREEVGENGGGSSVNQGSTLRVIPLVEGAQALFVVGTDEEIRKAEQLIREVEGQVGDVREKVVWRYKVKHSDPEELAEIVAKIYEMLIAERMTVRLEEHPIRNGEGGQEPLVITDRDLTVLPAPPGPDPTRLYKERFYQDGGYIINPRPLEPGFPKTPEVNVGRNNFIVDLKSNSLVMVVDRDLLSKLKELIRELDIPKKMVQIEVLLFEKRMRRDTRYGLNLLKLGTGASNTDVSSVCWNDTAKGPENAGILQLLFSRKKSSGFPEFDWAYRFLMTQEDVQINSSPSVITLNQTPALIGIKDEISINTGIFEIPTEGTVALKDAFTRAQYGITMTVTPTIHLHDETDPLADPTDYVTLNSDITFDTILPGGNPSRPDVNRRQITNEVRIADGQTVILGGLRRKNIADKKEQIPFIGELPGIGKLFSTNEMRDDEVEMFIFITPKIVSDPSEELIRIRQKELCKRPGDTPSFLYHLNEANRWERERLLRGTMQILFGRPCPTYFCPEESLSE